MAIFLSGLILRQSKGLPSPHGWDYLCCDHSLDSSFWLLTLNYTMGFSPKHCLVISHNHITDGTQMLSHASSLSTAWPPGASISVLMILEEKTEAMTPLNSIWKVIVFSSASQGPMYKLLFWNGCYPTTFFFLVFVRADVRIGLVSSLISVDAPHAITKMHAWIVVYK